MKFNICVLEPQGQRFMHFLYDPIRNVQLGLQSLGHVCTVRKNHLQNGWINILYGAHTLADPAGARAILDSRAPYLLVQTEVIRNEQVNSLGTAHWHQIYLPLLKGARRIWDWSESQLGIYRTFGVGGDILQLGFHPDLEVIRRATEKPIQALFFGSITPHRRQILDRMMRRKIRVHVAFDDVSFYRNDLIAHASVVLTLQQSPGGVVNQLRLMLSANNRTCCAGEVGELTTPWVGGLCESCPPEVLPEFIEGVLARDPLAIGDRQYEHFSQYPTTGFLEPLVERLVEVWR